MSQITSHANEPLRANFAGYASEPRVDYKFWDHPLFGLALYAYLFIGGAAIILHAFGII